MTSKCPPPRLHIVMAEKAQKAVIIRRGPTNWYHLILWHTDNDTIEHGAWFRGRIYEERCDLSPDGKLFVYFAMQGRKWGTSYKGSWTAISRPPWLHALTLWPQGDTWGGGGKFVENGELVIQADPSNFHLDHPPLNISISTGSCGFKRTEGVEWCGKDQSGESVYTLNGAVFRRLRESSKLVVDLNDLEPGPTEAPEWAKSRELK